MIFFALKQISETCLDQERSFVIQTPKYLKEDTLSRVFPMNVSGVGGRMARRFLVIIMYLHLVGLRFSKEAEMQSARALTSF